MADYIKKARKLERRKDYLRAAEYYVLGGEHDRAIELFVRENLYLKAAKICERIGKKDQAAEYYGKIGDYNHAAELLRDAGDYFNAGIMFKRAKRHRQAAEMFERSGVISESARMLELEKDYKGAAERYLQAEMVRSAAICFERAADLEERISPIGKKGSIQETEAYKLLVQAANAWKQVPNLHKAARLFERAMEWKQAGELYEACGETERALACYENGDCLEHSIALLKRLKQYKRAMKLAAKRSGIFGDHLTAAELADKQEDWATAAENYEKAGRYADAAERYERIGDYLLAAEMYFRAENYKKAAYMYELAGNDETAAKLFEEQGVTDKAIQLYIRVKNYIRAAQLLLDEKEVDEALRLLLRISKDHPSSKSVNKLKGICYFRLGKLDVGREYTDELLKMPISQMNIDVKYEYACALYEKGDIDKALELFHNIVTFDRDYKDARQYLNWLAAIKEELSAEVRDTVVGELPIGLVINYRYELLQLLGKGGIGIVYRAADRELNLAVALKILRPKYSYDPDFIEMIKREVTLARMLAHPNIIKIYDLNRAGNLWFVSMEFLQGEELKEKIKREGALPERLIHSIMRQALSGLAHSHKHRLVHSDIKPQNIFINSDNHVTIVDFGIARATGSVSEDKMVSGTPEYIAPEQIQGEPASVQSDLYSFGVTLYEMATGEMAFSGNTLDDILEQQLEIIPPEPRILRPDISPWLNDIIVKLMQKSPEERFQSAEEVLESIPATI